MDAMEAILSRRSIRQYTNKAVPESLITELLHAAMAAPSAGNEQPWHFIVVRDRASLDAIPQFHPYSAMLKHASVAVVVCGDLTREKFKGFWVQDCSAATENLLLAAAARGLGAVWTALYPMEDRVAGMRKLLGLPEHVVPLSLVPIGYPAEYPGKAERFSHDRIHQERW
jgi:nitroreductase